jgi:ankyrin repeat protein
MHCATINQHGACVSLLLDKGADPNIKDKSGKTPKNIAEGRNYTSMLDYFSSKRESIGNFCLSFLLKIRSTHSVEKYGCTTQARTL